MELTSFKEPITTRGIIETGWAMERFYVRAPSVNAVRRSLNRAPGGARVIGRFDRETIECAHTMDAQSFERQWPVIKGRLERAGLLVVDRPSTIRGE